MFTTEEKKILGIAVIGLLIGIAAYSLAGTSTGGGNNYYNNTTSFAGSSITFYLHNDTVTGIAYTSKVMNRTITPTSPERNITYLNLPNGNTFLGNWTSDGINVHLIPSGAHQFHADAYKTGKGGTHVIRLFFKCYMIDPLGNAHLHGTSELSTEILAGAETEADMDFISMDINTNLTDRMHIEVWANQTGTGNLPDLVLEFDDLTDSRLIIPATQQDITGLFNQKVNKTGDNMTGYLNNSNNISAKSFFTIPSGLYAPLFWDANTVLELERNQVAFRTVSVLGTYFGANVIGNNFTHPGAVQAGQQIFSFFGAGYNGTGFTGSRAKILMYVPSTWNATNQETELVFGTTINNGSYADKVWIKGTGEVIIKNLSGVGDRSVCVHADGTLFAC